MTAYWLHHRVDELFVAAIELPAAQRAGFLDNAARDDPPEVRQRVMELIAADERADDNFAGRSPLNLQDLSAEDIRDPRIGQRIDDYLIRSRIASGGFATVYLATREAPYDENVAIKLLHRESLAAPSVVQRVLREMQALSDLRHPYIVTQLHSNLTADGEPYIVMEYIDGSPLDKHCDERQLSINQRLKLFQQVCEAVQFAHRQGWVHRDLKPSNILVTDDGTPKLLDFGIAKLSALQRVDVAETLTQDLVGTPQYMSPEQYVGSSAGPATDVYALGAILYELISGHRVFDVMCRGIDTVLLDAIQGAIKDTIPRRPSTLVVSDDVTATGITKEKVAVQRGSSPSSLKRCLEGDIDNIAMMALRKEPARRYASAAAVAEDIQRWLDHRPVMARRDSLTYRGSKFVRRHRRSLLIGMVVASCISLALVTWNGGHRASLQRDTERAQRFIESAEQFIEDDEVPQAIARFHAAHQVAPLGSEMRDAAARLLSGWRRYLGTPLGTDPNVRYAFSQNKRRLVVSRPDGISHIWQIPRMRQLGSLQAGGPVVCQAFSPEAKVLLTVTKAGKARLWDLATGQPSDAVHASPIGSFESADLVPPRLRGEQKFAGTIMSARLAEDRVLLLEASPGQARLVEWIFDESVLQERTVRRVSAEVMNAEFASDDWLVVALQSGETRRTEVWDTRSLQHQRTITEAAIALGPRKLGANGTLIAQSYRDGSGMKTAVVVPARSRQLGEFPGQVLAVNDGGTQILTKTNRRLQQIEVASGITIRNWQQRHMGRWDAAFHVDDRVLVAEVRNVPRLHAVVTAQAVGSEVTQRRLPHPFFSQQANAFDRAEFDPLGRSVLFVNRHATGSTQAANGGGMPSTRVPWVWSVEPFAVEAAELQLGSPPRCLAVEDDLVLAATKNALYCWTASTQQQQRRTSLSDVTSLAIAPDKQFAVAGDTNGTIFFIELPVLRLIKSEPHAPGQAIRSLSLSHNGTTMLATTQEAACLLVDQSPLSADSVPVRVATCKREKSAFRQSKLSANGTTFAVASHLAVRCCDTSTGLQRDARMDLRDVPGQVGDFVFTDEYSLAASIHEGAVFLHDDHGLAMPLDDRTDIECVALRPDGKVLAVGHGDGAVQFWDTVARKRLSRRLRAGSTATRGLAFSDDGQRLVSATENGTLRVWDTAFRLPYAEKHLSTVFEVLTGLDMDLSTADAPRQLDQAEWSERYQRLENTTPAWTLGP